MSRLLLDCAARDGDVELMGQALGDAFLLLDQKQETHQTPSGAAQAFRYYRYQYSH